jgi:glutamine amidotransferase
MTDVAVVRTGTANLASVLAGLQRCGAVGRITTDPEEVREARHVCLPGVGAFGAAMANLELADLVRPLVDRLVAGLPTLAICLGMQLLCEGSEESPGVRGLGVYRTSVSRFSGSIRIPQLGWNHVVAEDGFRFLESGCAYFANSYRLESAPEGAVAAVSDHGGPFVAAFEVGNVLACQFHPELSGAWGLGLMERWLRT